MFGAIFLVSCLLLIFLLQHEDKVEMNEVPAILKTAALAPVFKEKTCEKELNTNSNEIVENKIVENDEETLKAIIKNDEFVNTKTKEIVEEEANEMFKEVEPKGNTLNIKTLKNDILYSPKNKPVDTKTTENVESVSEPHHIDNLSDEEMENLINEISGEVSEVVSENTANSEAQFIVESSMYDWETKTVPADKNVEETLVELKGAE